MILKKIDIFFLKNKVERYYIIREDEILLCVL